MKIADISRFDSENEPQAWVIAHAFSDIEDSCIKLLELFQKLIPPTGSDKEILDVLNDIGEELRHVLYHIRDMSFYRYLND